jgi:hypothetical protein
MTANIISKTNLEYITGLAYTDNIILAFVNPTEMQKSFDLIKWAKLKKQTANQ